MLMRTVTLGALLSLTVRLAAQDNGDLKRLQGAWISTIIEKSGKPASEAEKKLKLKIVVEREQYTIYLVEKPLTRGKFILDPSKSPKAIDAVPSDGPYKDKAQPGVYQWDGDRFLVNFTSPSEARPKALKTEAGTSQTLQRYERVK